MRIQVDENLPLDAARLLVMAGYDALHVQDQQLSGASDMELTLVCQDEDRALITLDTDLANIRQYRPKDTAGYIVMRLRYQDKAHVIDAIAQVAELLRTERVRGACELLRRTEFVFATGKAQNRLFVDGSRETHILEVL
mgnify:FL=1